MVTYLHARKKEKFAAARAIIEYIFFLCAAKSFLAIRIGGISLLPNWRWIFIYWIHVGHQSSIVTLWLGPVYRCQMLLAKKPDLGFLRKKTRKFENCPKLEDLFGPKKLRKNSFINGKINFFFKKKSQWSQEILALAAYARLKKNTKVKIPKSVGLVTLVPPHQTACVHIASYKRKQIYKKVRARLL